LKLTNLQIDRPVSRFIASIGQRLPSAFCAGYAGYRMDREPATGMLQSFRLNRRGSPMQDDGRSEATAKIAELLAKSRELMRRGDMKGADKAAREAIRLRQELADAKKDHG
jgi:hypothetical protein